MEKNVRRIVISLILVLLSIPVASAQGVPDTVSVFVRGTVVDELDNPLSGCEIIVEGLGTEVNSRSGYNGAFLFKIDLTKKFFDYNITIIFKIRRYDENGYYSQDYFASPRKIAGGALNLPKIIVPFIEKGAKTDYSIWDLLSNQIIESEEKMDSLFLTNLDLKAEIRFFTDENNELTKELLHYIETNEDKNIINTKLKRTILELNDIIVENEKNQKLFELADTLPKWNFTQHIVTDGESLSSIASQMPELNFGDAWKLLYFLNYDKVADPNLIYPSQKLRLPVLEPQ